MELPDSQSAGPGEPSRRLAAGLSKIAMAMRHHAWAATGASGLTPTQAQVLALLLARGGDGMPVTRIAAELAVTQPTISDAVAALTRKRLVSRARLASDARCVLVQLTRRGAVLAAQSSQWPDALLRAIDALPEQERGALTRALVHMVQALQEGGHIPLARMCVSCVYFRPNVHADAARPHHCAYVDAPLADGDLRIDCPEHDAADAPQQARTWTLFVQGQPLVGAGPTEHTLHQGEHE